ncbi:MAG: hypothetical protein ABI036_12575 [Fibrobacteria bacterium]
MIPIPSRIRSIAISLSLATAAMAATAYGASSRGSSINDAALFYHQGRYDSALARLEAMGSQGPFKRRDSLSLYQYLGMASARLGRDSQAAGYFTTLLGMDSLFQFPKNEDPQVLQAFAEARDRKAAEARSETKIPSAIPLSATAPLSGPVPAPATSSTLSPPPDPLAMRGAPAELAPLAPGWSPEKTAPPRGNIGIALGAVPFGAGWLSRNRVKPGLTLGLLQAGGIGLSLYASHLQTREANDIYRVRDDKERAYIQTWQWVQIVSLSTAVGAYLFSLIAAAGD